MKKKVENVLCKEGDTRRWRWLLSNSTVTMPL